LVELPDNSGTNANLDFTNNEFLTHGFETGSVTPTYTADLSTSSWTTAGTGTQVTIDTTNEEIDFSMNTNNGHFTTGYYDLTAVSDTNWIIRSQLDIDTVTQGSVVNDIFFGYGIGSITNSIKDSQDFLGLMIRIDDTKTDIFAVETDGSAPNNETTTLFTRQAQAETLYVELKRDSATSFTVNLYSDSGYSTLLESQTITVPSTVSGLQYIKVAGVQGFSDSELIGSVSNIKFYNDMTTTTEDIIPDKSTNNISVVLPSLTQEFTSNLGGTTANGISTSQAKGSQLQSGHALIGTTIGQIDFNLACSGTCSGTLEAGVWTTASQTPDVSFGTLDFSTVPSTLTTYSFNSNSHTLAVGDVIGVSCIGCSGTPQAQMSISSDNDPNEVFAESNPSNGHTSWLTNSAHDVDYTAYSGQLSSATSTTGVIGTGIQNPDLSFTDSNLPDNTDDFSVGSWVKLDTQIATFASPQTNQLYAQVGISKIKIIIMFVTQVEIIMIM
jgi:hypothetical protein